MLTNAGPLPAANVSGMVVNPVVGFGTGSPTEATTLLPMLLALPMVGVSGATSFLGGIPGFDGGSSSHPPVLSTVMVSLLY